MILIMWGSQYYLHLLIFLGVESPCYHLEPLRGLYSLAYQHCKVSERVFVHWLVRSKFDGVINLYGQTFRNFPL